MKIVLINTKLLLKYLCCSLTFDVIITLTFEKYHCYNCGNDNA